MKLVIPIPEKISLNKIYAGVHFRERASHKDDWYYSVLEAKPKKYTGKFPVEMHYHFKICGTQLDISNHGYMVKMCEDALVACGVLPDDNPKYVRSITITAQPNKKGEDDVVIINIST